MQIRKIFHPQKALSLLFYSDQVEDANEENQRMKIRILELENQVANTTGTIFELKEESFCITPLEQHKTA